MEDCTLKLGEKQHTLLKGESGKKYILGVDPNMSDSPNADYFAMAVLEIDEETKTSTLVHTYAGLGNLKNHVAYFHYIMKHFNIVFIILDNAGSDVFLSSCNESELFKKDKINIKLLDFNSDLEGLEYDLMIRDMRKKYNLEDNRIAINQVFTSNFIRKGNEYLQACIDYKKIWFASNTGGNEDFFNKVMNSNANLDSIRSEDKKDWTTLDFIENQDDFIYQTKKQCALVEYTSTSRGNQNFDLPQHLKRSSSANKARKDNYSALMLANWGYKCYNDTMSQPEILEMPTFSPIMIT